MADDLPLFQPTRRQRKIIDVSEALVHQPTPADADRAFLARPLVQATLPHRNPGDVPVWSRRNGHFTLAIQPGFATDPKTGVLASVGFPYGSLPRLLIFWMNTEAVRKKSRRLELGDTLSEFLRKLGLDETRGGKTSDARRLQEQMRRLFFSRITFEYTAQQGNQVQESRVQMEVAAKSHLWWDVKQPNQGALWGSWIELGEDFFKAITENAVPLDFRVLRALKQSPMALDLYAWLLHRAWGVTQSGKPAMVPWRSLMQQIGSDYAQQNNFVRHAKKALTEVEAAMLGTRTLWTQEVRGGLMIHPGGPPLLPRR